MESNNIIQYLTCPITKLIFSDPVVADDGYFYENLAIKNHLNRNNTSPVTGERISSIIKSSPQLKKLVDEFIERNPEFKSERFYSKKPFYLFSKDFIKTIRDEEFFENLFDYTTIMLNAEVHHKETLFELICKSKCPDNVVKHIIDNSIDYDTYDRRKLKPIHIACKYSSPEIILHLVKKGVDCNSCDLNGETPLGYLIMYNKKNMINDFFEKGNINVNTINYHGYSPIHYIIKEGDIETFRLFLKNNLVVSLTSQKLGGLNLLQYAFKECPNFEFIKDLIDLKITLDVDIDPKTSCEQLLYTNNNFNKKQKQELVLHYLKKVLNMPVVVNDFIDNINTE